MCCVPSAASFTISFPFPSRYTSPYLHPPSLFISSSPSPCPAIYHSLYPVHGLSSPVPLSKIVPLLDGGSRVLCESLLVAFHPLLHRRPLGSNSIKQELSFVFPVTNHEPLPLPRVSSAGPHQVFSPAIFLIYSP
jgi:hypothetical protein